MSGVKFLTILSTDHTLLPCEEHPGYAFFLLNSSAFVEAWHVWLGPALHQRKHLVSF